MSVPHANYLKNTIPQCEQEFVDVVGQIPVFSSLPSELLSQLFCYSKFVALVDDQRVIEQGMFDQEIFVLLKGALSVLLKDESGSEELIDMMQETFTLFGERSLLGEPRGATIKADGNVFLLGIDLSSLPDMLDGIDHPENRAADEEYLRNIQMYIVFSIVLTQRLDRLIRDQYKLRQRLLGFQERQSTWTLNFLKARLFNQFYSDEIPQNLKVREIITKSLKKFGMVNPAIRNVLTSRRINTRQLYTELMKQDALGKISDLNGLIMSLIGELTDYLKHEPDYSILFEIDLFTIHEELKEISTLGDYLNGLYKNICDSGALGKKMSKEVFLDVFMRDMSLNPPALAEYLRDNQMVRNHFDLAHIMFLVCQQTIYGVSQANRHIRDYVKFFHTYDAPHQDKRHIENRTTSIVEKLLQMQTQQEASWNDNSGTNDESEDQSQENVEDLLKSLGM
ncbi:MAG: cyclic nucleotide-binding domain-containing protein [SAR324 cluster bacterium]|nr:cyclic nucleotide-binding domain-containing protein [SAR324 cluster bacterium]